MQNKDQNVRVRFAPAPTGIMHIGNVRAALLNYLFARQKNGTFVLRIEDTDAQRMFDEGAKEILFDLNWLGLEYDEGPVKGGPYGPYFQSQRSDIYKKSLDYLIQHNFVYRCFCTQEELEKKRKRQQALKQPPRYDKSCLKLTKDEIAKKLIDNVEFIWRFDIPVNQEIEVHDLAKGTLRFNTKDLTDFPLTRTDGSFTFLFANAVDDIEMKMTHVFRGEDHLTNSASQILLYRAFNAKEPKFLHLPIICNLEGKKLSKRDFGFSIKDLQKEGYLAEAICNYLGLLGGSYEQEIMDLHDLIREYDFDNLSSTSQIKYDPDKLKWLNHKWIQKLETHVLIQKALPFITESYPEEKNLNKANLERIINLIKTDLSNLKDVSSHIKWYIEEPVLTSEELLKIEDLNKYKSQVKLIFENLVNDSNIDIIKYLKDSSAKQNIPLKILMQTLRMALTNHIKGPHIQDIIDILGQEKVDLRIKNLIKIF